MILGIASGEQLIDMLWPKIQNLPKNFLAPSALRSLMTNGHRCSTLLREKRSRFSTTTTLAPSSCASMAVRRPHGPAPMISTCITILQHQKERENERELIMADSRERVVCCDRAHQRPFEYYLHKQIKNRIVSPHCRGERRCVTPSSCLNLNAPIWNLFVRVTSWSVFGKTGVRVRLRLRRRVGFVIIATNNIKTIQIC